MVTGTSYLAGTPSVPLAYMAAQWVLWNKLPKDLEIGPTIFYIAQFYSALFLFVNIAECILGYLLPILAINSPFSRGRSDPVLLASCNAHKSLQMKFASRSVRSVLIAYLLKIAYFTCTWGSIHPGWVEPASPIEWRHPRLDSPRDFHPVLSPSSVAED